MKKINARHNDKDRIICKTCSNKHALFYQPAGTKEKHWLFDIGFSPSVFTYFRDNGRNMDANGFSLTFKELYQFKDYHNFKLARLMERIPRQVEYVIKEIYQESKKVIIASRPVYGDYYKHANAYDDGCAA